MQGKFLDRIRITKEGEQNPLKWVQNRRLSFTFHGAGGFDMMTDFSLSRADGLGPPNSTQRVVVNWG